MVNKISIEDSIVNFGQNHLIISRKEGFAVLNNDKSKDRFMKVKSIIKYEKGAESFNNILDKLNVKENVTPPFSLLIDNVEVEDVVAVTNDFVTAMVSLEMDNMESDNKYSANTLSGITRPIEKINILIFIDKKLSKKSLLKLNMKVVEGKVLGLWELDVRNKLNELFTGKSHDSIIIACRDFEESSGTDLLEVEKLVKTCVSQAIVKALRSSGYSVNITDFINNVGVEIDDLVEAGMDLCVGVEKTEKIYQKLKNQILKSLGDINVITLIMAGIRVEEDYQKHRLEEVDADDDPAYLYADEVLGMAIANQIAGTKAMFNFKRYDEEKPGIISELGPMLDDVFAGLVAGCMSKIFEE
ncbi:MAG: alpha-ribazole phosphatase CobZ [Methanobacteriaceae archaeon]|nr:alpha-ribazole phosphatase CobZ [Methanobacteriaceae archaeon]